MIHSHISHVIHSCVHLDQGQPGHFVVSAGAAMGPKKVGSKGQDDSDVEFIPGPTRREVSTPVTCLWL